MNDTYREIWEQSIEKRFDRIDADQLQQRNSLTQLEKGQEHTTQELKALQERMTGVDEKLDGLCAVLIPADIAADVRNNWHKTKLHTDRMEIFI